MSRFGECEPRFDMWPPSEGRSSGNTSQEENVATALRGLEVGFQIVHRSNQFDQFSELDQHEKSRRGIWSSVLTCDNIPRAVDQWIPPPPDKRNVGKFLSRAEVRFQKYADLELW